MILPAFRSIPVSTANHQASPLAAILTFMLLQSLLFFIVLSAKHSHMVCILFSQPSIRFVPGAGSGHLFTAVKNFICEYINVQFFTLMLVDI